MTVLADFSLPAEQFVLSHTIAAVSAIDIGIERLITISTEGITPYFHASGENLSTVDRALADDPNVTNVTILEDFETERFYRVHWSGTIDGFMPALQQADAAVRQQPIKTTAGNCASSVAITSSSKRSTKPVPRAWT